MRFPSSTSLSLLSLVFSVSCDGVEGPQALSPGGQLSVDEPAPDSDDADFAPAGEAVETAPLAFAGVESVLWNGSDGLEISWLPAVSSRGPSGYTVEVTGDEVTHSERVDESRSPLLIEGLAEGEYTVRVVADDGAHTVDGGRTLTQLVSDNRLVYRSERRLTGGGGGGADVWGEGNTLVIAGYKSDVSFMVVDATDPEEPELLSEVANHGFVKDVKLGDGLLFTNGECGCRADSPEWDLYDGVGARIWDFADPAQHALLGEIGEPSLSVHNVAYAADTLYLTDNLADSVAAWDIVDPTEPAIMWMWEPPSGQVHDQIVVDDVLYIAFWKGFALVDVSDPFDPKELVVHEYEPSACHNIWPVGDGKHVLTTDEMSGGHLRIWDYSDPDDVQLAGEWYTDANHIIHNVHVQDGIAFVSYYIDGVVALDLEDPANPVVVGSYDTFDEASWGGGAGDKHPDSSREGDDAAGGEKAAPAYGGAWGVWPTGEHIAVGDMSRGLIVLDYFPVEVIAE